MAGRRLLRARRARRRSWCATRSSSTAWSSSCCGARRPRPGTWRAATPARSRSATPRSSASARTPRRCSGRGGGCRRGSACSSAPAWPRRSGFVIGFLSNRLRGPYFVLATIAFSQVLLHRRQPLARLHVRLRGHPRPLPAGLLDARHRGQARVGRGSSSRSPCCLYLVELYLERSRRGYQLAAVREDEDAALSLGVPARRLKVAAIAVSAALTAVCRRAVGAVRRLRRSVLRVLGRPLGALRAGRDHRRPRHRARARSSAPRSSPRWRRTCARSSAASAPGSSGST